MGGEGRGVRMWLRCLYVKTRKNRVFMLVFATIHLLLAVWLCLLGKRF